MHIPPFNNSNIPIVDTEDSRVPLNYFNIVKLKKNQSFEYKIPGYETCIVPATGSVDVSIEGVKYDSLGQRTIDVWDGEPEGVYVPTNIKAEFICKTEIAEIFVPNFLLAILFVASNIAPIAPTDAASVGVAKPVKIDPSTAIINERGGNNALRRSL